MKGTIIVLTYANDMQKSDLDGLMSLVKSIENEVTNKEDLTINVGTVFGKKGRMHHHILINREISVDIKSKRENGQASIEYIKDAGQYKEILHYVMH